MSAAATIPVLYLDIDFRRLRVSTWRKAMRDWEKGKIEVVEYSRDHTIKGVSQDYPMPAVVRLLRRFKRDKLRIKFSRLNIYARDGFRCQYDGKRYAAEDLTFDHVVPRAQGGKTNWENIVTCCRACNHAKADRTPYEAGMALVRMPKKPHDVPAITVKMDVKHMPPEWAGYWSDTLEDS